MKENTVVQTYRYRRMKQNASMQTNINQAPHGTECINVKSARISNSAPHETKYSGADKPVRRCMK